MRGTAETFKRTRLCVAMLVDMIARQRARFAGRATLLALTVSLLVCRWIGDAGADTGDPPRGFGLSSTAVHKIYGGAILGLSGALLLEDVGAFTEPRVRYVVPGVVIASGALLTIDPLLHGKAAPTNYKAETRQHMLLGGLLLAAGGVDLAAEADWLEHWSWGLVLPAGMLATSATFLFHAQHGDPTQHELLTAQHRVLGATIAAAAIAKGLSVVPAEDGVTPRWPEMETAWVVGAGLAGIQLLLYTEGSPQRASGHSGHASRSLQLGVFGQGLALAGVF